MISSSSIIFGANSSRTAMRALHSAMISARSAGVISRVSFVCLISFNTTCTSSSAVRSSRLSIALFLRAARREESVSFLALSPAFMATTISFLTSSILLIVCSTSSCFFLFYYLLRKSANRIKFFLLRILALCGTVENNGYIVKWREQDRYESNRNCKKNR